MPDTAVGIPAQLSVTVANAGTGPGEIDSITVQGTAFALEALPPLPVIIPAGQTQQFTIDFAPRTPDPFTGSLKIGNDSFALSGTGLGSRLQLTYLQNGTAVPVAQNGTIVFNAVAIGSTSQSGVTVLNTGTIPALISGVIPTSQNASYSVPQLPLPVTLGPQQSINFTLVFTPSGVGQISGSLAIETSSWNLLGIGTPPPGLPGVLITTDSGTVQPLSQPVVRLALSSTYPMALHGTLTLSMALAPYGVDSATQWISGGQTVVFSIPAGTTDATFTGGVTAIGLQVGTLAGTLAVTPSFSLNSGYSLTPSSPGTLSLSVPATPPQLLSAQLQLPTSNSFSINVVGYSPTRQLSKLIFQFTPITGTQLAVNRVEVDVSAAAVVYYHNPLSQAFGGFFSVTVPITLSTDQTTTASLLAKIQAISVLASSDQGDSPHIMIVPNTP